MPCCGFIVLPPLPRFLSTCALASRREEEPMLCFWGESVLVDSAAETASFSHGNFAACLLSSLHHDCSVSIYYELHKLEGCPETLNYCL